VLEALSGIRSLDTTDQNISFALDQVEALLPEEIQTSGESLTDDQARQIILNHLSPTPCDIDHLNHATQLPTPKLLAILMELELMGQVQRIGGNQVARV